MKRRPLIATLTAFAVVAAAILLLWHPWDRCDAPEPICLAQDEIQELDNVVAAEVDYDAASQDSSVTDPLQVLWEVRLRETLSPRQAAATAEAVSDRALAAVVDHVELEHSVTLLAGQPQGAQDYGIQIYPLRLWLGEHPGAETDQAFSLWQQGAARVDNAGAVAPNADVLLDLAQFSQEQGYEPTLELADGSIRYTPNGEFSLEQVRIAVEARDQPNVDTAIFGSGILSVHSNFLEGSTTNTEIKRWLDEHAPLSEPTAYSLSGPGYESIQEGWIGKKLPEHLIAKPPVLPEGVTAWPDNPQATTCTQENLQLSLSEPDAALGSRYLSLYARNMSQNSCALQGYPQIVFLNAAGEPQISAATVPETSVSAERTVIPAGEYAISTLTWKAMSTSQDPDETTALSAAALPGLEPATLSPISQGIATPLDILDGAQVRLSPWLQAAEGRAKPGT